MNRIIIFRATVGPLIVLMGCFGNQQTPKDELPIENKPNHPVLSKTRLKIENRGNRGARFTDSEGADYWLINIASAITNEDTIPLDLHIAFSKEYDFPIEYGGQKFNVFLLPEVFTLDGVQIVTDHVVLTDSMQVEFRKYIDSGLDAPYKLYKTLEPGEKCVVAIGTLYPNPPKSCGIFPNMLFTHTDAGLFPKCNWLMEEEPSANAQIGLGLKLNLCQGGSQVVDGKNYLPACMIIPCGQISYPEYYKQ